MSRIHQLLRLTLGTAAMLLSVLMTCTPAMAADGTPIDFVWIQLDYDTFLDDDAHDENDVSVSIQTSGVYLDEKSITNLPSIRWSVGTRPVLKLVLRASSGYYFSSSAAKSSGIYIDGYGDYSSASRSDSNSQLTVKIKLEEVEEGDDDDDDDWYDWNWPYNYSSTTPGGYGPGGGSQSSSSGAWLKDSTGWWYCYPDKTYPKNAWLNQNGLWYYFGADGYLYMNRWLLWNNLWYYCGSDGSMLRNTYTPDGYWVGGDGVWYPSANYYSSSGSNPYYYSYGPGVSR